MSFRFFIPVLCLSIILICGYLQWINKTIQQNEVMVPKFSPEQRRMERKLPDIQRDIWVHTLMGRFGNHLFQYATAFCLAERNHLRVLLQSKTALWTAFDKITATRENQPTIRNNSANYSENSPGKYDERISKFISLHPDKHIRLFGFYQSWRYFDPCQNSLRSQFTLSHSIKSKANDLIQHARYMTKRTNSEKNNKDLVYIGVHVRRRDMLKPSSIKMGYSTPPVSYYYNAISYFKRKYSNCVFIVSSDDYPWCEENLKAADIVTIAKLRNYPLNNATKDLEDESKYSSILVEFATLVLLNHTIISSGTFGWWAGWLSGGDVIYYQNFPAAKSSLATMYNKSDYYPPQWIPHI